MVSALYCLYGKLYRIIGLVIFLGGIIAMPFLPRMISDYELLNENVYLTFFLTLVSVVRRRHGDIIDKKETIGSEKKKESILADSEFEWERHLSSSEIVALYDYNVSILKINV